MWAAVEALDASKLYSAGNSVNKFVGQTWEIIGL